MRAQCIRDVAAPCVGPVEVGARRLLRRPSRALGWLEPRHGTQTADTDPAELPDLHALSSSRPLALAAGRAPDEAATLIPLIPVRWRRVCQPCPHAPSRTCRAPRLPDGLVPLPSPSLPPGRHRGA
ncbi:hypothetical protein CDD83_7775 [Cordyceps sp. RAO-2017]|nr:hypothetical protein CDD83_7775 [Cordyceps sp. RAO-2017]